MNNAPEGLNYGPQHRDHESDCLESVLERGKFETGATHHTEHDGAEALRMKGEGSHDPYFGNSKKNK